MYPLYTQKYSNLIFLSYLEKDHEKLLNYYKGKYTYDICSGYEMGLKAKEEDIVQLLNENRKDLTEGIFAQAYGLNTKLFK